MPLSVAVELNGKIHVVLQSAEANQKKSDYVKESSSMHLAHQQLPKALQTFSGCQKMCSFSNTPTPKVIISKLTVVS